MISVTSSSSLAKQTIIMLKRCWSHLLAEEQTTNSGCSSIKAFPSWLSQPPSCQASTWTLQNMMFSRWNVGANPAYLALVVARMQCKLLQVGFPLKHLAWLWLLRPAATWMLVTLPWNLPILKFPQVELNAPKTIRSDKLSGFLVFNFATGPSPATRRYWILMQVKLCDVFPSSLRKVCPLTAAVTVPLSRSRWMHTWYLFFNLGKP